MNIPPTNCETGQLDPKICELLDSCGISPLLINPIPIGRGGNHLVYSDLDREWVVKVPINQRIGTVGSAFEEEENINLYLHYFHGYSVPTTFLKSAQGYCAVMDYVDGCAPTSSDMTESIYGNDVLRQLKGIIEHNRRLMLETGKMIDLVGLEGLLYYFSGRLPLGMPARLTNLRICNDNLFIVDYDLVRFVDVYSPLDRVKSMFAYRLNVMMLKHYFNTDYE